MDPQLAARLASLALAGLHREYPNSLAHLLNDASDARTPRELHPAFYGCLDWHSSVHGHWMLVRLLGTVPDLACATSIRAALRETLTAENLAAEAAYFDAPHRQSFERTYGWAWLLQLATELHASADDEQHTWANNLLPLERVIVARYRAFLPKQRYPIRTGVHANTAFGLTMALDYARVHDAELAALIVERATAYFAADRDVPASWEPGGEDFLSPALEEADLMRRVLPRAAFAAWLHGFLPRGLPAALDTPAIAGDRSDPKLAHLDGLNLSRAWCLRAIAGALPAGDHLRAPLAEAAERHASHGLAHVATGHYMGEHWLASFAVYLLSAG